MNSNNNNMSLLVVELAMLVLVMFQHGNGCLEEEREALLQFKTSMRTYTMESAPLSSWVGDECCDWERVQCNLTTGHVIRLSLDYLKEDINSTLNASMFVPFKELQLLNLSHNSWTGWLQNEGLERLSNLTKLEVLDVSWNTFNTSILTSLSVLPSLKKLYLGFIDMMLDRPKFLSIGLDILSGLRKLEVLDLSENYLDNIIMPPLGALPSLKELYLRGNYLNGSSFDPGFMRLSKWNKLEILDFSNNGFTDSIVLASLDAFKSLKSLSLSSNNFNGSFPFLARTTKGGPPSYIFTQLKNLEELYFSWSDLNSKIFLQSIGRLTSLKKLHLGSNDFNGTFPIGLCNLKILEELHLNDNNFHGSLPTCLSNLTSLRVLDLTGNQFTGNISSSSPISTLTSLEAISLAYNNFGPTFPLVHLANHSKLVEVYLSSYYSNHLLKVEIDDHQEFSQWFPPKFQLKILTLKYCNFNKSITDVALKFLSNQYELEVLHLSHAGLRGNFPTWLMRNNPKLKLLDLRNNSLTGPFLLPSYSRLSLIELDISANRIQGNVQENIGEILPNLKYLNMSRNDFGGNIPSSIGAMRQLDMLDMSHNYLSGEIPDNLTVGCNVLGILKLSNNRLQGKIFPKGEYFNLTQLNSLYLDENEFIGGVPIAISKCLNLFALNVGKNKLTGTIPPWIGNLIGLSILVLRDNSFEGFIPHELCKLNGVEQLDLSQNNLSGSIPSCSKFPLLKYVHLLGNKLTGLFQDIDFLHYNAPSLMTLNLGDNNFSGSIPSWIGALTKLKVLILKGNNLNGSIPHQLCLLNKVGVLDLSRNNLAGSIPPCFENIAFGKLGAIRDADASFDLQFTQGTVFSDSSFGINSINYEDIVGIGYMEQQEVEFTTKSISITYKGKILNLMSLLDLSCNKLTGEIPHEFGELNELHGLNLSHNLLSGKIPGGLSNMEQLESLDVSHNQLSGEIPSKLIELNALAVFLVAYNNLSGRIPSGRQFGTFDESSYQGNPLLCGGPPLAKKCLASSTDDENPVMRSSPSDDSSSSEWEDKFGVNAVSFFVSCAVSYVMCLLSFFVVLYINPHWRRGWFYMIEETIDSCTYFFIHIYFKLFIHPFM